MKKCSCLFAMLLVLVAACSLTSCADRRNHKEENWGSFTSDKAYSYDGKYYALQTVEKEMVDTIKVTIYLANENKAVAEFFPARAWDFWGICWESDTYNIWMQSGDRGVCCYSCQDEAWTLDENATRPEEIISKYDTLT